MLEGLQIAAFSVFAVSLVIASYAIGRLQGQSEERERLRLKEAVAAWKNVHASPDPSEDAAAQESP
jgi:hypothetical protein